MKYENCFNCGVKKLDPFFCESCKQKFCGLCYIISEDLCDSCYDRADGYFTIRCIDSIDGIVVSTSKSYKRIF